MEDRKIRGVAEVRAQQVSDGDLVQQRQMFEISCGDRVNEIESIFRFSLDELPTIDRGDITKHPLDFGQELRFELNDGREISLRELYQYRTYEGYLVGLPHPYMAFKQAIDVSRKKFKGLDATPIVLPPVLHTGTFLNGAFRSSFMTVPLVCSIACFSSDSPASDKTKTNSDAIVLWFQDSFGLDLDERTTAQFREIDWKSAAVDWDW